MAPLNVLMVSVVLTEFIGDRRCTDRNLKVGTGEYTTGFVNGAPSGSDKKVGVVGLTLFDLRRRGKVGELSMVGTTGKKFPAIRNRIILPCGEYKSLTLLQES